MCDLEKYIKEYKIMSQDFLTKKSKVEKKKCSQYFTPLNEVEKMLESVEINKENKIIRILDPACGCGILPLKLLEKILKKYKPEEIIIDCYDIDIDALGITEKILSEIKIKECKLSYNIYNFDFLKVDNVIKYDYIITNPPYKKMRKNEILPKYIEYLNGQPNMYTLFLINSLNKLKENGVLVMISPKNYLSGVYSRKIREYILENFSIDRIHTFDERRKIFENVLQEICIIHIKKSIQKKINLSYNGYSSFFVQIEDILINSDDKIIITPKSIEDLKILRKFKKFDLGTIGKNILFKPGKVVQFRVKEKDTVLKTENYLDHKNGVPLIISRHIRNDTFEYKEIKSRENRKIITIIDKKIQDSIFEVNSNYLFIKKNVDKGVGKLLISTIYLKNLKTEKIGIDNGVGYFTNNENNLDKKTILGIKCLFESKQFNSYYHMVNSNHTINVSDFKNMYIPKLEILQEIGEKIENKVITEDLASIILEEYLKKVDN